MSDKKVVVLTLVAIASLIVSLGLLLNGAPLKAWYAALTFEDVKAIALCALIFSVLK